MQVTVFGGTVRGLRRSLFFFGAWAVLAAGVGRGLCAEDEMDAAMEQAAQCRLAAEAGKPQPRLDAAGLAKLLKMRDPGAFLLTLACYDLEATDEALATIIVGIERAAAQDNLNMMLANASFAASTPVPATRGDELWQRPDEDEAQYQARKEAADRDYASALQEHERLFARVRELLGRDFQASVVFQLQVSQIVTCMGAAMAPAYASQGNEAALKELGPRALPTLLAAASNPKSLNRVACYWALRKLFPLQSLEPLSPEALQTIINDRDSPYRELAVGELASGTKDAAETVSYLLEHAAGSDPYKDCLARAFGFLGVQDPQAIAWLKGMLESRMRRSSNVGDAWVYLATLTAFAQSNDQIVDYFCELLESPPTASRDASAQSSRQLAQMWRGQIARGCLGQLGPRAKKAIPLLGRLLQAPNAGDWQRSDQKAFAATLGRLGPEAKETLLAASRAGIAEAQLGLDLLSAESPPSVHGLVGRVKALNRVTSNAEWLKCQEEFQRCSLSDRDVVMATVHEKVRTATELDPFTITLLSQFPRLRCGAAALAFRLEQLDNADPSVPGLDSEGVAALGLFRDLGRPLVPWLMRHLQGSTGAMRVAILKTLVQIAIADESTRPAILAVLQEPQAEEASRQLVEEAIPKIRSATEEQPQHASATEPPVSDPTQMRVAKLRDMILGREQEGEEEKGAEFSAAGYVESLMASLHGERVKRGQAIDELAALGPAAKVAVPALLMGLRNRYDDTLAGQAALALAQIDPTNKELLSSLPQLERAPWGDGDAKNARRILEAQATPKEN